MKTLRIDFGGLPDDLTGHGQDVFFRFYARALDAQHEIVHPKAGPIPMEHWQTIVHNLAFLAACCAEGANLIVAKDG